MSDYQDIGRIKSELNVNLGIFSESFRSEIIPKISADLESISLRFPTFATVHDVSNCALLIPKGYDITRKGIAGLLSGADLIFLYSHKERAEKRDSAEVRMVSGLDVEPHKEEAFHD